MDGFKFQFTINATLSKEKINGNTEYAPVYFNSITNTVINLDFEYSIDKCFQEILYRINNWINEGSGWIVESINSEYVNISKYAPLFCSSFIELPDKLKHPMKGLINIKNNDNKCFLWCHVRHLNLVDKNSSRISKIDKKIADALDYSDINFQFLKKIILRLKIRIVSISMFFQMMIALFIQFIFLIKILIII